MGRKLVWCVLPLAALGLSACTTIADPRLADRGNPQQYSTDLQSCMDSADLPSDKAVKKRFYNFLGYPVTYPLELRREVRACLQAKGYQGS